LAQPPQLPHQQSAAVPGADLPALLLRFLRGRALGRRQRPRLRLPDRLHGLPVRLRAVAVGFGIARDFETGFGRRYLLAATDRRGIIAGYGIAALGRAFVTWTVLTTVALVAGMNIDGSGVDLVGMYTLAILVNITATLWASGIALRIRSIQAGPLMQLPIFLILFLAPVYVPLSLLSGWIHAVASVNPVTALLEAGRGFISGDPTVIGLAFGLGIVLPMLFALWSRGGLRRAEAAG
jgi:ABC-2 type transport system permease protein